ncbi:UPF0764 protein C16orf89 homolog [Glandiceps talaboti]
MAIRMTLTCVMLILLQCLLLMFQVTEEKSDTTVYTVLHAVDKIVQYYDSEYMNMNLDGTYGLRVVEGQSSVLLDEYGKGLLQDVPTTIVENLQKIQSESKTIADKTLPYIEKKDVKYYNNLSPLMKSPWRVFLPHKKLNDVLVSSVKTEDRTQDLDEHASDRCMSKLLGTDEVDPPCTITPECWTIMTRPNQKMYALTHQVLYFSIGYQMKCSKSFDVVAKRKGMGSVRQIQDMMCGAILQEVRETANMGYPSNLEDLFMEQVFIGASLGYVDFVNLEWLEKILSWQFPNGCYGDIERKKDIAQLFEGLDASSEDNEKGRIDGLKIEHIKDAQRRKPRAVDIISEPFQSRKLQRTQHLNDGCEAHKTAVAAGAVVVHLRYFINPGPPGRQAMLQQSPRMNQDMVHNGELQSMSTGPSLSNFTMFLVVLSILLGAGLVVRQFFNQRRITFRQSYFKTTTA